MTTSELVRANDLREKINACQALLDNKASNIDKGAYYSRIASSLKEPITELMNRLKSEFEAL